MYATPLLQNKSRKRFLCDGAQAFYAYRIPPTPRGEYQMDFTVFDRVDLIDVALGKVPADLVVRNGKLVDVNTREIYDADVAVKGRRIACVGDVDHTVGSKTATVDAKGKYLVPGLIDGHFHVDDSLITVTELAKALLPRGVTAVLGDPHEIASVLGMKGIGLIQDESKNLPLKVFILAPSHVPAAPGLETTGAEIGPGDVKNMLCQKDVLGLGEMNPPHVLDKTESYLRKIRYAYESGKVANGHAAGLTGRELNAFIAAGLQDCHETVRGEEALEKLRLGMKVLIGWINIPNVMGALISSGCSLRNCLLCIDDIHPTHLVRDGHLDHAVRMAIREGLDSVTAVQMATINCAEHYNLDKDLGSIAPGKIADIILLDDLENFRVNSVLVDGELVSEKGRLLMELMPFKYPEWAKKTIHLKDKIKPQDFEIKAKITSGRIKVRTIQLVPMGMFFDKKEIVADLLVRQGNVQMDIENDVLEMAVVERHKATGNIGKGFVKGFGLKHGAIASSVSHDHHNIVVLGTNHYDMATSVNRIVDIGGGFTAVKEGVVIGQLELPVAGLMSEESIEVVAEKLERLEEVVSKDLKGQMPFFYLIFISLPSIPELGLTDKGLVDTRTYSLVDLMIE